MHLGNVRRILEKRVKLGYASSYMLLSYSLNISRMHYYTLNARDSFYISQTKQCNAYEFYDNYIELCRVFYTMINSSTI